MRLGKLKLMKMFKLDKLISLFDDSLIIEFVLIKPDKDSEELIMIELEDS